MEMTPEEFAKEYLRLYQEGEELFAEFNPCEIRDGTCIRGRNSSEPSFCCELCGHLTDAGCSTQCLWCKLWVCNYLELRLASEFKCRWKELRAAGKRLTRRDSGRKDLSRSVELFYEHNEWQEWKKNNK